ncbi:hypothetical protein [Pseudomonas fluorescens]|uniref:hypothetical protein n=1 Tax=Pseudomonas fluorescens TaxID=294 RepID=UPI001160E6FD|nr:hypothetical protein [Pseudomonas fluorescens]
MLKSFLKPGILAITLFALPTIASASGLSGAIGSVTLSSGSSSTQVITESAFSHSCTAGKFAGYVQGVLGGTGRTIQYVRVDRYRIVKTDGHTSRNKANVNIRSVGPNGTITTRSADAMKQDRQWHDLKMTNYNRGLRSAEVEMIFDKSGPDIKCKIAI